MNKPCPFCGGECRSDDAGKWWIECGRGCFTGPMYPTESEAWTAHNAGPVHALAERDGEWRRLIRERAELHEMAAGCDVDMSEIEAAGHRGSAAALRLLLEDGP